MFDLILCGENPAHRFLFTLGEAGEVVSEDAVVGMVNSTTSDLRFRLPPPEGDCVGSPPARDIVVGAGGLLETSSSSKSGRGSVGFVSSTIPSIVGTESNRDE